MAEEGRVTISDSLEEKASRYKNTPALSAHALRPKKLEGRIVSAVGMYMRQGHSHLYPVYWEVARNQVIVAVTLLWRNGSRPQ